MKNAVVPKRHPAGLPYLFLSEMWERFGFYIVQSLLILYLVNVFNYSDSEGYALLGAFTAFVYISPVIGGYLADKILGFRLAIIAGGVFLAIGYGGLAWLGREWFELALSCIIIGNGFFKPNISSLLGTLYENKGAQRDAGFTIFYIGINLGALLATLSGGFIKEYIGWWASYMSASIGLLIGVTTFIIGFKKLGKQGLPPKSIYLAPRLYKILHSKILVLICATISILLFFYLLHYEGAADTLFIITGILVFFGLLSLGFKERNLILRHRIFALIALLIASIFFWAVFFQIFFSVNLFVERDVNRQLFNMTIPASVFIAFEAIFIILLGPFLAKLWQSLEKQHKNPSTPMKFALGVSTLGLAFLLLSLSVYFHDHSGLIPPVWVIVSYFFVTLGEMLLSPIGLSAVTILAPARLAGLLMGIWFITLGFGGKLAGIIAEFSSIPKNITNKVFEIQLYQHAFLKYAILCFIIGFTFLLFTPLIKRWMNQTIH